MAHQDGSFYSIYKSFLNKIPLNTENSFIFDMNYVKVMSKLEALFIQDLIDRSATKKSKHIKNEDRIIREYFQCSIQSISKEPLSWDRKIQKHLLNKLEKRGYVKTIYVLKRRWIHIDIIQIENDIDKELNK